MVKQLHFAPAEQQLLMSYAGFVIAVASTSDWLMRFRSAWHVVALMAPVSCISWQTLQHQVLENPGRHPPTGAGQAQLSGRRTLALGNSHGIMLRAGSPKAQMDWSGTARPATASLQLKGEHASRLPSHLPATGSCASAAMRRSRLMNLPAQLAAWLACRPVAGRLQCMLKLVDANVCH